MQIACIHLQQYKMKGKQELHGTKDGAILKARNDQQCKHIHDDHKTPGRQRATKRKKREKQSRNRGEKLKEEL